MEETMQIMPNHSRTEFNLARSKARKKPHRPFSNNEVRKRAKRAILMVKRGEAKNIRQAAEKVGISNVTVYKYAAKTKRRLPVNAPRKKVGLEFLIEQVNDTKQAYEVAKTNLLNFLSKEH